MTAPTPTGPIAVAVAGLRTLVSNLTIFQTITGAADAAAALNSVFYAEVGLPIVRVVASGGTTTISLARFHTIEVGDTVTIQGASLGGQAPDTQIDGEHVVLQVGAYEVVIANALDDGSFTPDRAFLIPSGRPFAVVSDGISDALKATTIGTGGSSVLSGTLELLLEADVSSDYVNDPGYAQTEMRNTAGELLRQLIQTQGTGDFIVLNDVELVSCDFIPAEEHDDTTIRYERWRALIRCTWGLSG